MAEISPSSAVRVTDTNGPDHRILQEYTVLDYLPSHTSLFNSPSMDRLKSISKSGWHPSLSSSPSYDGASESRSSSSGGGVTARLTKNFKSLDQVVCSSPPPYFFCFFLLCEALANLSGGMDGKRK